MTSGIYQIKNIINGYIYIGSTKNLQKRKSQHFSNLLSNIHHNRHLQSAYNKYGKDNFTFEVLFICDENNLLLYEQYCIDVLKPEYNKKLFNRINTKTKIVKKRHSKEKRVSNLKGKPNNILSKIYTGFISPDGTIFKNVFNLHEFCREHDLQQSNLCKVYNKVRKSHKGWTLYNIE